MTALLILIGFAAHQAGAENRFVTLDSIRAWQQEKKDFVLIDVRDPESFQQEHIPGAINVPAEENENIAKFRSKQVVLYCWYDGTSSEVAEDLKGYDVFVLTGGIEGWKARGWKTIGNKVKN